MSSLDPLICQRAAGLLIFLGDCSSDPALSGVRGLNSELKTNNHSLPLSPYSLTTYRWIKQISNTITKQKHIFLVYYSIGDLILSVSRSTSVSAADSSSVHQRSASLLNPAGHCYSDPALSGQSLRIVELMTQFHNAEQ